jgi:hypothetical protein
MKLLDAFLAGIRKALHAWPVALITFFVNLVMAGIAAQLFKSSLSDAFGNSLAPDQFINGFSYSFAMDLLKKNPGLLQTVFSLVAWMVVVHNFLFLFFNGGIIASVQSKSEKVTLRTFFEGCGEYFGRFFRLFFIVALAGIGLVFVLGIITGFLYPVLQGDGETEIQILKAAGSVISLFVLSFSILLLIADYAQVITVAGNERKMIRAFWAGVQFVFRRFFIMYGLFLLFTIGSLLIVVVSVLVGFHYKADSGLALFGIFILQQILMMLRAWWRVAAIGGQVELYGSMKIAPKIEIVQEPPNIPVSVPVRNVVALADEQKVIEEPAPVMKRTRRSFPRKQAATVVKKKVVKRRPKKPTRK